VFGAAMLVHKWRYGASALLPNSGSSRRAGSACCHRRDLLASLTQARAGFGLGSGRGTASKHPGVLDSSWQWLGEVDRSVIKALGVFVGGFTREAAEAVAGADLGTLSQLSQLALIQRLPDPYGFALSGARARAQLCPRQTGAAR
jgi:hypothetical protein